MPRKPVHRTGFYRGSDSLPTKFQKENHPRGVVFFLELVMGVSTQSAGCLSYGLRSLLLALPRGGRKPHRGFLCPPSDSLPTKFQKENHPRGVVFFLELVMGVGPMNLVITNDALYQLSYTSAAKRIIAKTQKECKSFFSKMRFF